MPEPTAATTLITASVGVQMLTAFGVPLGLRADLLVAGFAGSLVAIILLNSVPSTGDTWRALLRTSARRMAVACASSITAGYLTPLVLLAANAPDTLILSIAFVVGVFAQKVLVRSLRKVWPSALGGTEGAP